MSEWVDSDILYRPNAFKYPELHWWTHVNTPIKELNPCITRQNNQGPRERAKHMTALGTHMVAFDVWWSNRSVPSKGFMRIPAWLWFEQFLEKHIPQDAQCFSQIIWPNQPCRWYFSVYSERTSFAMESFVQVVFEEMVLELKEHWNQTEIDVATLWKHTLLFDGSNQTEYMWCQGMCPGTLMIFENNHSDMKRFAYALYHRIKRRPDATQYYDHTGRIPLDLSVYSPYATLYLQGQHRINTRTPLRIAPYNEYDTKNTSFYWIEQHEHDCPTVWPRAMDVSHSDTFHIFDMLPLRAIYAYLTLNGRYALSHRGIAFEWESGQYMRHKRFDTRVELQHYMEERDLSRPSDPHTFRAPLSFVCIDDFYVSLDQYRPRTIHVGPVYADGFRGRDWERKHNNDIALAAPLVFDIDMVLEHRAKLRPKGCHCGPLDKCVCDACFTTMLRPMLNILHYLLGPQCLDLKGVFANFSGRKGFHIHITDARVWEWTDTQRARLKRMLQHPPQAHEPLYTSIQRETGVSADTWWYTWPALDEAVGQSASLHMYKLFLLPHAVTHQLAWPIVDWRTFVPSHAPSAETVTLDQMERMAVFIQSQIDDAIKSKTC